MSLLKPAATLILTVISAISILLTAPSSSMYAKSATENKTSTSSSLPSINQVHGTLIVTNKVINEGGGNKKPSDFTINIHANDPVPSSFPGNSSGTRVQLHMGMYSITETKPPGYNLTLSGDCSGGMMSVETKNCTITNFYSKP
jgi:hypothetical protein